MSFLHVPLIAIGSLFVGVPILLHLLMRRKPKPMVFPALRFVRQRQQINQRRMKLRHLLLLLLRCAALVVLAAALARPFVPIASTGNWLLVLGLAAATALVTVLAYVAWSEPGKRGMAIVFTALAAAMIIVLGVAFSFLRSNPSAILVGDAEPPVAAALIVDRSPRMGYQHQNEDRLTRAKTLASWLLGELPKESDLAVVDTTSSRQSFAVDRDTAVNAVEAMEVDFRAIPLPRLLEGSLRLLQESAHPRKEIYVFTDLTEQSWREGGDQLREEMDALGDDFSVYLVDVGVTNPSNLTLYPPMMSAEQVTPGSAVELNATVSSQEVRGSVDLELVLELPDPNLPMIVNGEPVLPKVETRGRSTVMLDGNSGAEVAFTLRGLNPGTHHGQIRARRDDGLMADNVRYFTLHVGQPWKVLLISEPEIYSEFISGAIAPMAEQVDDDSLFSCETKAPGEVRAGALAEYAAVALVDPHPLGPELWSALESYVSKGGSLTIVLGREATPISDFNSVAALSVLPGRLVRQFRNPGRNNYLTLPVETHPMLGVLRARGTSIPWNNYPVFRHWELDELKQSTAVLLSYTNGLPAVLESKIGNGKVVTITTPFTDPLNVPGRDPWNLLPTGPEPWPYVVLVNELFRYLVSDTATALNYQVGESASVEVGDADGARYQLFSPRGTWQPVTPQEGRLQVPLTDTPGVYRVRNTANPERQAGFSVNLAVEATQLTRIDRARLDPLLGDHYRIAKTQDEIVRDMSEARRGREFYPWLMLCLATVLGLEMLLSNRFYGDGMTHQQKGGHEPSRADDV